MRDLLRGRADEREGGGHVVAQRLEGAQQDGEALALDRLADEQDAQRSDVILGAGTVTPDSQDAPRWARSGSARR